MLMNRRIFLKAGAALSVGTVFFWRSDALYARSPGSPEAAVLYQIPGGSLDPVNVPKYQTPLLIPPVMPAAGRSQRQGGKNIDYYEISVKQFEQQILPASRPKTTVWGYGAVASDSNGGSATSQCAIADH